MRFKTFINEVTRKPEHTHAVTRGGNVVSYHTSSKSAYKKADSLDQKHGATVHSVKLLESPIKKRQVEPPPEAMPSDTRVIKPRKNTEKRTTGSFNKFGNFTPGMKEEVEQFKVGDKVSIHAPDDLDWHERKGELVSTSDDGHVVKLSGGAKLSVSKHQIKKIDEEVEQIDEISKDVATKYKTKATNVKRVLPSLKREFQRKIEKAEALAAQHSPGGKLPRGVGRNPAIAAKAREEAAKAKKSLAVFDRWETNRTKGLERAKKHLAKEEVEQIDEGMLDDYIEGKIAAHHKAKSKEDLARHDAARETLSKKIKPFNKKIATIKGSVTYKNKEHPKHAVAKEKLQKAKAERGALSAEREKHYDAFKKTRDARDSATASDIKTYHNFGLVGLGLKKLKQKLTKEEMEILESTVTTRDGDKVKAGDAIGYKDGYEKYGQVHKVEGDYVHVRSYDPDTGEHYIHRKHKSEIWKEMNEGLKDTIKNIKDYFKKQPPQEPSSIEKRQYAEKKPGKAGMNDQLEEADQVEENYAIAAKIPQTFKIFRGGIKGKGSGTRRTHTNKVADHVKIFKESSND